MEQTRRFISKSGASCSYQVAIIDENGEHEVASVRIHGDVQLAIGGECLGTKLPTGMQECPIIASIDYKLVIGESRYEEADVRRFARLALWEMFAPFAVLVEKDKVNHRVFAKSLLRHQGDPWAVMAPKAQRAIEYYRSKFSTILPRAVSLRETVSIEAKRIEGELIRRALQETDGNVVRAARKLQIASKVLRLKMWKHGISIGESTGTNS